MTLSPPVRVVALVAALALTGLAGFLFLMGRGNAGSTAPAASPIVQPPSRTTPKPAQSPAATSTAPVVKPKPVRLVSGWPDVVTHALRYNRVVVVAVYVPGASVDAFVQAEAQAAAKMARAAYIGVSTEHETALQRIVLKAGVLPDPAVVVVKRPGTVSTTLGVADRQTIAQAVLQAKGGR